MIRMPMVAAYLKRVIRRNQRFCPLIFISQRERCGRSLSGLLRQLRVRSPWRPYHGRCRIDTKDQIGNEQDESSTKRAALPGQPG
jgi:hypothetical protein